MQELIAMLEELQQLKLQHSRGLLKNTSLLKKARKKVARFKTKEKNGS